MLSELTQKKENMWRGYPTNKHLTPKNHRQTVVFGCQIKKSILFYFAVKGKKPKNLARLTAWASCL